MNRRELLLASGGITAASVLYSSKKLSAAEKDEDDGVRVSSAKTSDEQDKELFKEKDLAATAYTSHFNFDNRRFPPNPTTTAKYWCKAHCKLANGDYRTYTHSNIEDIMVGELEYLPMIRRQVRVVSVQFSWKLEPRLFARRYFSEWVHADPGMFINYAYLVWQGENSYERPIYLDPLAL